MHLRIYLWLACVVLAGYVRATEVTTASPGAVPQNDALASDKDPYDDGSGVGPDESSGSGWGAGPGDDDEDSARGGSGAFFGLTDDEDLIPSTTAEPTTPAQTILPNIEQIDVLSPRILSEKQPGEGVVEQPRGAGAETPSRPDQIDIDISAEDNQDLDPERDHEGAESRPLDNVFIMNAKSDDPGTSFFAQPGILAAVIGGAVVGLLCAILVVMFIVYRMRKKDEGSYALDEPKRSPAAASYGKGHNNREFYA